MCCISRKFWHDILICILADGRTMLACSWGWLRGSQCGLARGNSLCLSTHYSRCCSSSISPLFHTCSSEGRGKLSRWVRGEGEWWDKNRGLRFLQRIGREKQSFLHLVLLSESCSTHSPILLKSHHHKCCCATRANAVFLRGGSVLRSLPAKSTFVPSSGISLCWHDGSVQTSVLLVQIQVNPNRWWTGKEDRI